jgi:hypothetical protein
MMKQYNIGHQHKIIFTNYYKFYNTVQAALFPPFCVWFVEGLCCCCVSFRCILRHERRNNLTQYTTKGETTWLNIQRKEKHLDSIYNERRNNLTTTQILNGPCKKGGIMLPGPQRPANNTPISRFYRRGTKTQTSAVQDFKY